MPNYSLVANSVFQPFTYQELAAPLDRQDAYHENLMQQYEQLSSKADVLEAMGKNDRDKGAYAQYKAYSDALRAEADNLYRNGLNSESRMRLTDLRRRYNTEIVPLQNAWNKREQEADMQMKAQMSNPSLMFTRDARTSSLDEYLANPSGGFGVINGANITAQMASMAKNLEKQIRSGNKENIDDFTYRYVQKYGLDANMISNWRNNPTLSKMYEQVMKANGVTEEALQNSANAQNIWDKSTGYAEMGMWNAIGEDKSQIVSDFKSRADYEHYLKELEADNAFVRQYNLEMLKGNIKAGGEGNYPKLKATNIGIETADEYSSKGLEELEKLKGGTDGLKASYFGKTAGQINPMKIYEEYQEELKKHEVKGAYIKPTNYGPVSERVPEKDKAAAKKAVLEKYSKYGVTEILNDRQYEMLSGMGYDSSKNNPNTNGLKYSTFVNGFNNLVKQKTAYDIPMADGAYKETDSATRAGLIQNKKSLKSKVFEYNGYKKGEGVGNLSDVGVNEKEPDKSAKILMLGYDPNYKGYIRVTYENGKVFLMDPEIVGGVGMKNDLKELETKVYKNSITGEERLLTPQEITSGLAKYPNHWNPGASSTSDKAF